MTTLYLCKDKDLHTVTYTENYQGENNFETLRIFSAERVSGHDLSDCIIECHLINPNGEGDIVQLNFSGEPPSCDILLSSKYTAVNGELTVFLKIFCEDDIIGLTNEVTIKVREHQAVTSYIPESQLTLLDQYSRTFQRAEEIINSGLDEEMIAESLNRYLKTHDLVDELTAEEVSEIFEEE